MRPVVDFASNPGVSERAKQNKHYQIRAMRVLGLRAEPDTPAEYHWIWPPGNPQTGEHRVRWTILGELGRVKDEELMRALAARVCELKLKTRDAVSQIRKLRVGQPAGDALALANLIIKTINDYMNTHAGVTLDDARAAVRTVAGQLAEPEA